MSLLNQIELKEFVDDGSNDGLCPYCGGMNGECDQDAEAQAFEEYIKAQGGVMSGRKLKKKKKPKPDRMICPNCGEKGPHFVPPSLGEPGFFMCKKPTRHVKGEYDDNK